MHRNKLSCPVKLYAGMYEQAAGSQGSLSIFYLIFVLSRTGHCLLSKSHLTA